MRRRTAGPRRPGIVAVLALALICACGGSNEDRGRAPTVTPDAAATRAGAGALGGTSAALTPAASVAPAAAVALEPVSAIAVVATDNVFTPSEFRVRAGRPFTLTLENKGQAVHDWRLRGLPDAEGKDAGTRLLMAGQSQTITLTPDRPGEFAVYCEVHPVDMRGRLVVVP